MLATMSSSIPFKSRHEVKVNYYAKVWSAF